MRSQQACPLSAGRCGSGNVPAVGGARADAYRMLLFSPGAAARGTNRERGRGPPEWGCPASSTKSFVRTEWAIAGMPCGLPLLESISIPSKPLPNSRRSESNRSAGTSGSAVKRRPNTPQPDCARLFAISRSASLMCSAARWLADTPIGSEGWLSTGAITVSSTIIAIAKFPVRHIPSAPTPGPPHSECVSRASARRKCVMGLEPRLASKWNSRLMHARAIWPRA